jgi:molecular chaperone GrpE
MKDETKKKNEEAIEEESVEILEDTESDHVAQLQQQVENGENKYRRALADYQNLQKRVQEEKSEWIKAANRDLILRILTVLDTLMLAQQHMQDKNLEVSIQQFLDILKSEGAIKIEAVGKPFDPTLMEAIATGEGEDGKVIEEIRSGFLLYEKLLRAAQVKVGKK